MKLIKLNENNMFITFLVTDDKKLKLVQVSNKEFQYKELSDKNFEWYRPLEIHISGQNQNDHHGSKHTGSSEAFTLTFTHINDYVNQTGRKIELFCENQKLSTITNIQFYENICGFCIWNNIIAKTEFCIEYVSSFELTGIQGVELEWQNNMLIHIPHNSWCSEYQWRKYTPDQLGLCNANIFSAKRLNVSNSGTWSSQEYLPMGIFENKNSNTFLMWQIEHNGSWQWEIGDIANNMYLLVSGPTYNENHWSKKLKTGENFETIKASVFLSDTSIDALFEQANSYRRLIRRKSNDNIKLPVIFNDYMNCLFADPTTEKLIPLIDKAKDAGCEIYCIDAGWYSDGDWWDSVGEWLPSKIRFGSGIEEVIDYIKKKGMKAGLWLELEVMGINCPLAKTFKDESFFVRNGERVIDHSRYQLDFSSEEVIEFANSIIDRLVNEYGIHYIKMDYNINAGVGTEINSDSVGDGLFKHNQAYIKWIDSIFERYPDLVIENCASGGLRADYKMLSRFSIQSSSDQTDYRKYAAISAASLTAITPEQCAVWSYPMSDADCENTAFNMINAMLMRIQQSGHLVNLKKECFELVKEGISCYKSYREKIPYSKPVWYLGLPKFSDKIISVGIKNSNDLLLAIWCLDFDQEVVINLQSSIVFCKVKFPITLETDFHVNETKLIWKPQQKYMARLFEIHLIKED